jgi:RNA polymerase sigma-70 factor (ECF subfamily)
MLRLASGDRSAFTELFDRHQASVRRFAYRFVGSRARAEELAQEIFLKLFKSAPRYQPSARFRTYLFRLAANHCLNEVRRGEYHLPEAPPEGTAEETAAPHGPHEALAGHELERAVGAALARLSERERAAFSLARFEGLSYREIAEALEASEAAVKSLIHRATLSVAKQLDAHAASQHDLPLTGERA